MMIRHLIPSGYNSRLVSVRKCLRRQVKDPLEMRRDNRAIVKVKQDCYMIKIEPFRAIEWKGRSIELSASSKWNERERSFPPLPLLEWPMFDNKEIPPCTELVEPRACLRRNEETAMLLWPRRRHFRGPHRLSQRIGWYFVLENLLLCWFFSVHYSLFTWQTKAGIDLIRATTSCMHVSILHMMMMML